MYKNKPRVNPTFINCFIMAWYVSLEWGPLGPIGVLAFLEDNFEVDSTFH